jgi:hypothetical protein
MEQRSLFGLSEHLARLSRNDDPLVVLEATLNRPTLPYQLLK